MNIFRNIILGFDNFFLYIMIIWGSILFIITIISHFLNWKNIRRKKFKNEIKKDFDMPVSVVLPVYNEEEKIIEVIDSILNLDYKLYEIIIVDDGSKDKTVEKIIKHYKLKKIEKVVRKKIATKTVNSYYEKNGDKKIVLVEKIHGGKSDTLNAGINTARFPYIFALNANVKMEQNSLNEMMRPIIENKNVSVVIGSIKKMGEFTKSYLHMKEEIQHNRFVSRRNVFDLYNGNIISEEGILLFKKDVVIEEGGYKRNVIAEDSHLLLSIHQNALSNKKSYKIKYIWTTIGYTKYANNAKELKRKEQKEIRGLLQSIMNHKNMFFRPKYKFVGTFSCLYYIVLTFIAPFLEMLMLISIILSCILNYISITTMIMYLLIYILFGTILNIMVMLSEESIKTMKKIDYSYMLLYSFVWNIGFRQISNLNNLISIIYLKDNKQKTNF